MSHLDAQIVRLYDTVFDRAPDAEGLEFWNNASHTGLGLRDLASFFISAPEFASTYGEPTNRGFVESMYLNVLDRPGEAEGIAFWTNALDSGMADRPQIVVGFSESAEHVQQMAVPEAPAPAQEAPAPAPAPAPVPPPAVDYAALDMTPLPETLPGPYPTATHQVTGELAFKDLYSSTFGKVLVGGAGKDGMFALGDRDVAFWGQAGDDYLAGGPGNDELHGGEGNDRLDGGPGQDVMTGGPGDDIFLFRPGDGYDRITDYRPGDQMLFIGVSAETVSISHGLKSIQGIPPEQLTGRFDVVYNPSGQGGAIHLDGIGLADLAWVRESFIFA